MASNSANIGRRPKRRKVQQKMDFSVAAFNNGGSVPHEEEDNCAYEDTTEEAVFNDDSQQVEH
ncbi:hypothetical protein OUZ56_017277 [Daphnia magna]|uniref:Uncharacterized protein n=1 Tax=Daphnia magna TaxID=35525 RepID=A0ABR0ASL9_9CRUS|nr:hypothetical protein OUZ56_017277 [Daphnia magna]